MARPIRYVCNGDYYFITNRCLLGQYLMRPDEECRRIIKGCLARAADQLDVDLVCFAFLSNHFHLVARFPRLNMSEFMERLQGQIAERLNKHRIRKGTVFPERFDDQALLDDKTLRDKIEYVLNNPVRADLVRRAEDWKGVSSMGLHLSGDPLEGKWLDYTKWRNLRRRKADHDRSEAMREHTVELHLPAALDDKDGVGRLERLRKLVRQKRRAYHSGCSGSGPDECPDVLGFEAAAEQDWRKRAGAPETDPGSRRMLGVASDAERTAEYHDNRRETSRNYRHASKKAPGVDRDAFPDGTYPPGSKHCVGHHA